MISKIKTWGLVVLGLVSAGAVAMAQFFRARAEAVRRQMAENRARARARREYLLRRAQEAQSRARAEGQKNVEHARTEGRRGRFTGWTRKW